MLSFRSLRALHAELTDGCGNSASSLGMMSEEERKQQRIEDIKELLA